MLKKILIFLISVELLLFAFRPWIFPPVVLSVTGEVKKPLHMDMDDLAEFDCATVRLNEVSRDGRFHGVFRYRGPALRNLLESAVIEKSKSDFNKDLDLAIVVRNKSGDEIVLSWGEIFYRNPSDVIIALEATPVIPHHDRAHIPKVYWSWLDQLNRKVVLPRLVIANDFYTDRSLEEITSIEVVDLHPKVDRKVMDILFSPEFTVSGDVEHPLDIDTLSSWQRKEILYKEVGDGQGYHGLKLAGGVPLVDILKKAGIRKDLCSAVVVSAPDGYRTLLSYGELFVAPSGRNVMIADMKAKRLLKKGGRFFMVIPDDLSADRNVKAIEKVEVISLTAS